MSNPVFPTLSQKQNSKPYGLSLVDPSIRNETDGGYALTRPRYTRVPPRKWNVTYTWLNAADKLLLEAFWSTVHGGSVIFDWQDTENNVTYNVRFVGDLKFAYQGAGATRIWDVTFDLEQA